MSSRIRTLVVDDEPLARERTRKLLEKAKDIDVVGECSNGADAVESIGNLQPDLVLLDVQMPELDGFGVLERLRGRKLPAIIFVTAHDKFALRAFDVHALDYLLKPFDAERFNQALDRARERLRSSDGSDLNQRISELLADLKEPAKTMDRLAVKTGGKVILLRTEDIDWVEAADNYVNLHIGNESHLHRETMSALESRLPADKFMRISRSTIVNVEKIKELQPLFHGEYSVILRNGARLTLSRSYRDRLQQLLGKDD
jgi:two-component system LytT family response regulator